MLKIVDLRAREACQAERFGGKAAGLARLVSVGARVPDGFAVEATRLEPRRWPGATRTEFCRRVEQLLGSGPVAVRSSAPQEDGARRSFAGIFETVLGIGCPTDAVEAAAHCIASGEASRLYSYTGSGTPVPVGLVVQRQVGTRSAGVCFTRDPTGRDGALVIEAVSGCGHQLVGGRATPEVWRIYATGLGSLEARREAGAEGPPVLDAAAALGIAREARELAERLGQPLDLEWARDAADRLWWLQARPITAASEPVVLHVERAAPSAQDGPVTVWSNFNLRETMPDPLPPLCWSLWRDRLMAVLLRGFTPASTPEAVRRQLVCVDRIEGRLYWNLNAVLAVPVFGRLMVAMGSQIDAAAAGCLASVRTAGVLVRRRVPGAWKLLPGLLLEGLGDLRRTPRSPEEALRQLEALGDSLRHVRPLGRLTAAQLVEEIRALTEPENLAVHRYIGITILGGAILELARWAFRRHPEAANRLAVGIRGNPTTEMSLALDVLVEQARSVADAFQAARTPQELLAEIAERPEGRIFLNRFEAFLEKNGQRGPKEFDLSVPRWGEQPDFLLSLIRAGVQEPPKETLRERFDRLRRERRGAIDAALAASPAWQRPLLRWLERAVERYMPLREAPKHHFLVAFQRVREILLELGSRLAAQGTLRSRDDVFFLDWRELGDFVAGRAGDEAWKERVEERRELLTRFAARPAPEFLRSDGVPVWSATAPHSESRDGALRGTGIGTGRATGRVRVLHEPEPERLREGEVLVVRFADPGWTPLFPRAAALVMEVGGVMCHAAVVARELGLPAVFGVRDATRLLADGQRVTVDGVAGTVTRAEGAPEPDR